MKFQINTVDDQVFKVSACGRVAIGTDNFSGNKYYRNISLLILGIIGVSTLIGAIY